MDERNESVVISLCKESVYIMDNRTYVFTSLDLFVKIRLKIGHYRHHIFIRTVHNTQSKRPSNKLNMIVPGDQPSKFLALPHFDSFPPSSKEISRNFKK